MISFAWPVCRTAALPLRPKYPSGRSMLPALHNQAQVIPSVDFSADSLERGDGVRRRHFVSAGLGLMAAAATEGMIATFNRTGLRAQPAMAPAAQPPKGKWIRL